MGTASGAGGPGVGRERELSTLRGLLDGLTEHAAWACITGEPGIGKTWLLDRVSADAGARGLMVIRGRGSEFERHVPFGLLVHALDDYLERLAPDQLQRLGTDRVGDLATVFPSLAGYGTSPPTVLQDGPYRAHRAIRALVERLAEPVGLVLVLDDLQWADPDSIAFAAHLLRRPPQGRVLLLAAWRDGPLTEPLGGLPLWSDGSGVFLRLDPLSRAEAAELVAGVPGPRRRAELVRDCGGNPFCLLELAAAPQTDDESVPVSIATAVQREMAELGAAARAVVAAAAVVGEVFDLAVVAAVAGVPDDTLAPAVDELAAAGLIREMDVARRFTFRSPVVRRGIYHTTPPGQRIAAHARAAAVLRDEPPAVRAPHAARVAAPPDPQAASVLVEAGRATVDQDPAVAAGWFRAARALAGQEPEVRLWYAGAAARAGWLREARLALADMTGAGVTVHRDLGVLDQLAGYPAEAWQRLRPVIEVDAGPTVGTLLAGAAAAGQVGDVRRMETLVAQVLRRLPAGSDPGCRAIAHALAGLSRAGRSATDSARSDRTAARAALDRRGSPHPGAALLLGALDLALGDYDAAVAGLGRLLELVESRRIGQWRAAAELLLARALYALGRLPAAAAVAEAAAESARRGSAAPLLAHAYAAHAATLVAMDDSTGAIRLAAQASAAAGGDPELAAEVGWQCDAVRLDVGELVRSGRLGQPPARSGFPDPIGDCARYDRLVRLALDEGRLDDAAGWARRAEKLADATGLALAAGLAGRARAATHLAARRVSEAVECAQQAVEHAARSGARVETGRIRLTTAAALTMAGQRERGVAALHAALEEFRAGGAVRYEREAARELRRLGRRAPSLSPGPAPAPDLPLSEREWQVAELVAAGRTNRQIAAALLLSGKTVETHLTRIFAKLGISSRAALARAVEQHGRAREVA